MDIKFKDNSKLKIGIAQLEYIESTGTQYIDTGIKPVANDEFEVTYMITGTTGTYNSVFGTRVSVTSNAFMFGYKSGGSYIELGNNNISSFNKGYSQNIKHTIKLENGNLYVDGVFDRSIVINQNTVHNLLLFTINNNGVPCEFGKCKIYNFIIKRAGVKVLELIPVKDANGIVCFYDTVSGTFFYNQGTGDFIAGPEVKPGLPENVLLQTISLYHENTPNVDGLQLLNGILNYQKTHQDEIKEYYYSTTQLWQDIITEYPDIVQYYNMNHKLCVVICEADDPEQCAEDFHAVADDIQQELEDYPSLIPIIAEYPVLVSIIAEWNPIVHSLVDTGYENVLQSDGASYIATNITPQNGLEIDSIIYGNSGKFYGVVHQDSGVGMWFALIGTNAFMVTRNAGSISLTLNSGRNEVKQTYNGSLIVNGVNCGSKNGTSSSSHTMILFGDFDINANRPELTIVKLSTLSAKLNSTIIATFVPFYRDGHYGMLDIHDFNNPIFYPNAGSGEFIYTLEQKL